VQPFSEIVRAKIEFLSTAQVTNGTTRSPPSFSVALSNYVSSGIPRIVNPTTAVTARQLRRRREQGANRSEPQTLIRPELRKPQTASEHENQLKRAKDKIYDELDQLPPDKPGISYSDRKLLVPRV
jgi:hypothetical protein